MIELKKLNVHRVVDSADAAAKLETEGYTVVTDKAEPNYSAMKVEELRAYADGKGIDLTGAAKKDDIIAKIKAAVAVSGAAQKG